MKTLTKRAYSELTEALYRECQGIYKMIPGCYKLTKDGFAPIASRKPGVRVTLTGNRAYDEDTIADLLLSLYEQNA
jgi:hypothetical protein